MAGATLSWHKNKGKVTEQKLNFYQIFIVSFKMKGLGIDECEKNLLLSSD